MLSLYSAKNQNICSRLTVSRAWRHIRSLHKVFKHIFVESLRQQHKAWIITTVFIAYHVDTLTQFRTFRKCTTIVRQGLGSPFQIIVRVFTKDKFTFRVNIYNPCTFYLDYTTLFIAITLFNLYLNLRQSVAENEWHLHTACIIALSSGICHHKIFMILTTVNHIWSNSEIGQCLCLSGKVRLYINIFRTVCPKADSIDIHRPGDFAFKLIIAAACWLLSCHKAVDKQFGVTIGIGIDSKSVKFLKSCRSRTAHFCSECDFFTWVDLFQLVISTWNKPESNYWSKT